MSYTLWEVSGKVIIPGTRKSGSFGPVRIVDKNRTVASKHLAVLLNEKFAKELRGENRFSDGFALMNLQWSPYQAPAKVESDKAAE